MAAWQMVGVALLALSVSLPLTLAQVPSSAKSCSELSDRVTDATIHGSPSVCGASGITDNSISQKGPNCLASPVTFEVAFKACTDIGMRLCTIDELLANEAKQTGCDLDLERVWSGSHLGCPFGSVKSTGGGVFEGLPQYHPVQCTPQATAQYTRCCADAEPLDVCEGACDADQAGNSCNPIGDDDYTCTCGASGWSTGEQGKYCIAPFDACAGDPCGTVPGNVCVGGSDSYTCVCSAVGYTSNMFETACIERPDACRNKPCSEDQDRNNYCTDRRDGTYLCTCGGERWALSEDFQRCSFIQDSCFNNICHSIEDARNVCIDNLDDTHSCECGGAAWQNSKIDASGAAQSCQRKPDACRDDPCSHNLNPDNVCQSNDDGSHYCECGEGFRPTPGGGFGCARITNPCIDNDPCNHLADRENECTPNLSDGSYFCTCDSDFFIASAARDQATGYPLRCNPIPNECDKNPCDNDIVGNDCTGSRGTYTCACNAPGFKDTNDHQSCVGPPDQCLHADEPEKDFCHTIGTKNECKNNRDGTYFCKCLQGGYITPFRAQTCIPPPNRCDEGNPCSTSTGPNDNFGGAQNKCKNDNDGSYTCECGGGWEVTKDKQRCQPPVNLCLIGDPCDHRRSAGNECIDNRDGSYQCTCKAPWKADDSQTHCEPPENKCLDDADYCLELKDSGNKCVDKGDGTHECICNTFHKWTVTQNKQACIEPSNPCDDNTKCGASLNNLNKCVYEGNGDFHCICNGRGWSDGVDQQRCIEPEKGCRSDGDPCLTDGSAQNSCKDLAGGLYECSCGIPFRALAGKNRCVPPENVCFTQDPCMTEVDRKNKCEFKPSSGLYTCSCDGRGWTLSTDGTRCLPPKNPCVENSDVCAHGVNPNNVCVNEQDGTYRCECHAPGWTPGIGAQFCQCPSPCALGDPCALWEDPNNKCNVVGDMNPILFYTKNPTTVDFKCPEFQCTCNQEGGWESVVSAFGFERCIPPNPCDGDPCHSSHEPGNHCVGTYIREHDPDPFNIIDVTNLLDLPRPMPQVPPPNPVDYAPPRASAMYPSTIAYTSTPSYNYPQFGSVGSSYGVAPVSTLGSYSLPSVFSGVTASAGMFSASSLGSFSASSLGSFSANTADRRTHSMSWRPNLYKDPQAYICECGAPGWTTPLGAQWCDKPDPCKISDPCSNHEDRMNKCIAGRKDGMPGATLNNLNTNMQDYYCECRGNGWYTPTGGQHCEKCTDPCFQGDPCSSNLDSKNVCAWVLPGAGTTASVRRSHDGTLGSNGRKPGECGTWQCECAGTNFVGNAPYQDACVRCNDPCELDPCRNNEDSANTCTHVFGDNTAFDYNQVNHLNKITSGQGQALTGRRLLQNLGSYAAPLNSYSSSYTPSTLLSGVPPYASSVYQQQLPPIAGGVVYPSVSSFDTVGTFARVPNIATRPLINVCGTWKCSCLGRNWLEPTGAKSCEPCDDPCKNDPCSRELDDSNRCVRDIVGEVGPGRCGNYYCECGGLTFLATQTRQSCVRCIDACLVGKDPCQTNRNSRNVCYSYDKSGQKNPVQHSVITAPPSSKPTITRSSNSPTRAPTFNLNANRKSKTDWKACHQEAGAAANVAYTSGKDSWEVVLDQAIASKTYAEQVEFCKLACEDHPKCFSMDIIRHATTRKVEHCILNDEEKLCVDSANSVYRKVNLNGRTLNSNDLESYYVIPTHRLAAKWTQCPAGSRSSAPTLNELQTAHQTLVACQEACDQDTGCVSIDFLPRGLPSNANHKCWLLPRVEPCLPGRCPTSHPCESYKLFNKMEPTGNWNSCGALTKGKNNRLGSYPQGTTLEKCKMGCEKNKDCFSVTFEARAGTKCWLHDDTEKCGARDRTCNQVSNPCEMFTIENKWKTCPLGTETGSGSSNGQFGLHRPEFTTLRACQKGCEEGVACQSVNWYEGKDCWFHNGANPCSDRKVSYCTPKSRCESYVLMEAYSVNDNRQGQLASPNTLYSPLSYAAPSTYSSVYSYPSASINMPFSYVDEVPPQPAPAVFVNYPFNSGNGYQSNVNLIDRTSLLIGELPEVRLETQYATPFVPLRQPVSDHSDLPLCGTYECLCGGEQWMQSANKNSCQRECENKCQTSDPCRSAEDRANTCSYIADTDPGQCGYHHCDCTTGWVPTFGSQGCIPKPANPCTSPSDPCLTSWDEFNNCILLNEATGDYECQCNVVRDFFESANKRQCTRTVFENPPMVDPTLPQTTDPNFPIYYPGQPIVRPVGDVDEPLQSAAAAGAAAGAAAAAAALGAPARLPVGDRITGTGFVRPTATSPPTRAPARAPAPTSTRPAVVPRG